MTGCGGRLGVVSIPEISVQGQSVEDWLLPVGKKWNNWEGVNLVSFSFVIKHLGNITVCWLWGLTRKILVYKHYIESHGMRTHPSFKGFFPLDQTNELLTSSGEMMVHSDELIFCVWRNIEIQSIQLKYIDSFIKFVFDFCVQSKLLK